MIEKKKSKIFNKKMNFQKLKGPKNYNLNKVNFSR